MRIAASWSAGSAATMLGADAGHQVTFDLFVHLGEQTRLVTELVIERAASDSRCVDDGLGRHGREAVRGEQVPARLEQPRPGGGGALRLGPALRRFVL